MSAGAAAGLSPALPLVRCPITRSPSSPLIPIRLLPRCRRSRFSREVDAFLQPGGSATLTWFYQVGAARSGSSVPAGLGGGGRPTHPRAAVRAAQTLTPAAPTFADPCRARGQARRGATAVCLQPRGDQGRRGWGPAERCSSPLTCAGFAAAAGPNPYILPVQAEPLRAKALAFSSVAGARGVQERSVDTDIVAAEVAPQVCSGACCALCWLALLLARRFPELPCRMPHVSRMLPSADPGQSAGSPQRPVHPAGGGAAGAPGS